MDLKELGLTKKQIADRVVETIVNRLMTRTGYDDEGAMYDAQTKFACDLQGQLKTAIDKAVEKIAAKHVLPDVKKLIEATTLQETNRWGEARGKKIGFKEYLVQRAEAYICEEVNFEGQTKAESRSSYWQKAQTRITHLIHQHVQYHISGAIKKALKGFDEKVGDALAHTIKIQMQNMSKNIRVTTTRKER